MPQGGRIDLILLDFDPICASPVQIGKSGSGTGGSVGVIPAQGARGTSFSFLSVPYERLNQQTEPLDRQLFLLSSEIKGNVYGK